MLKHKELDKKGEIVKGSKKNDGRGVAGRISSTSSKLGTDKVMEEELRRKRLELKRRRDNFMSSETNNKPNQIVTFPLRRSYLVTPPRHKTTLLAPSPSQRILLPGTRKSSPLKVERRITNANPRRVEKSKGETPERTRSKGKTLPYLGELSLGSAVELVEQFGFQTSELTNNEDTIPVGIKDTSDTYNQPKEQLFHLKLTLQQLQTKVTLLLHCDRVQFLYSSPLETKYQSVTTMHQLVEVALVNSNRLLSTLRQPLVHPTSIRLEPKYQKTFSDLFHTIDTLFLPLTTPPPPSSHTPPSHQSPFLATLAQLTATLQALDHSFSTHLHLCDTLFPAPIIPPHH